MTVVRGSRARLILFAVAVALVTALHPQPVQAQKSRKAIDKDQVIFANRVLWQDPGSIPLRNLLNGPGSRELAPLPPFTFIKEDKEGESPKLDVRDRRGVVWSVKLGEEAQSETTATRLVWAVGYFAEEAYYFENVRIRNLPKHLSRGDQYVAQGNVLVGARFEPRRSHMKRHDTWHWDKNPFQDTKHLSGLKVLMILLNNFDAREANNRILYDKRSAQKEALYYVTDLGATLGRAGGLGGKRTKNNLEDFQSTRFVMGIEDGAVQFDYDTRPSRLGHLSVLYPPYYIGEVKKEKSMRGIPVEHARWIGGLLNQLTDEQLHDAFRAANYDPDIREGYVRSLRMRIGQLAQL
jgi:hypothetical protein